MREAQGDEPASGSPSLSELVVGSAWGADRGWAGREAWAMSLQRMEGNSVLLTPGKWIQVPKEAQV